MKKEVIPLNLDAPLLSIRTLLRFFEIDKDKRTSAIGTFLTVVDGMIKLKTGNYGSNTLLKVYDELLINQLPPDIATVLKRLLEETKNHIESFLRDQKNVFYSPADAVDDMIEAKRIPGKLVKALLGGKWPDHPFNFDSPDGFMMEKDGTLVPAAGFGEPAPGPDFKLFFKMVNDPIAKK